MFRRRGKSKGEGQGGEARRPGDEVEMMRTCTACGEIVALEDRFCGNCGVAIAAVQSAAAAGNAAPGGTGEFVSGADDLSDPFAGLADPQSRGATSRVELDERFQPTIIEATNALTEKDGGLEVEESAPDEKAAPTVAEQPAAEETIRESDVEPEERDAEVSSPEPSAPREEVANVEDASASGGRAANTAGRETGGVPRTGTSGSRRATSQLEPGTLLSGRYEIVRRIGGGGMGAVYYAKDRNLGDAPRAVKEMVQAQLDEAQHEKAVNDFKRESMLLAELEHPSIPTIYDYFYDESLARFYLVMKYISGGDFLARLRNAPGGRLDELTVTEWGAQAADVLHYLHTRRPPIIYRDLKPANLMIDGNTGRVMLIDFGIARWVSPQEKGVTAVGTMGYAPPELFSGKVEPRSDIYSLGATMFHLLTGSDPQDNPLLVFDFNKNPLPRQINPQISNEMERILMRAVAYEPEGRFRSAAEMRDVLIAHAEKFRAGGITYGFTPSAPDRRDLTTVSVDMVYCGFCGGRIAADDVFCAHCGARQPIAAAGAVLRAARITAKLVVNGTAEIEGGTFQLSKENNLVGRTDPQSNIFPDVDLSRFDPDTKISRRHARIYREGDIFLVEDLGSVNGTVVNESIKLGPRQPRTLENGDRLRLGETTLHFLVG